MLLLLRCTTLHHGGLQSFAPCSAPSGVGMFPCCVPPQRLLFGVSTGFGGFAQYLVPDDPVGSAARLSCVVNYVRPGPLPARWLVTNTGGGCRWRSRQQLV